MTVRRIPRKAYLVPEFVRGPVKAYDKIATSWVTFGVTPCAYSFVWERLSM